MRGRESKTINKIPVLASIRYHFWLLSTAPALTLNHSFHFESKSQNACWQGYDHLNTIIHSKKPKHENCTTFQGQKRDNLV